MPRFVSIQNIFVHVPSLANILKAADHLGTTPKITLVYQNFKIEEIFYKFGDWKSAEKDYETVNAAMLEIENVLKKIPRYDIKIEQENLN
jgi:hypothetical protein